MRLCASCGGVAINGLDQVNFSKGWCLKKFLLDTMVLVVHLLTVPVVKLWWIAWRCCDAVLTVVQYFYYSDQMYHCLKGHKILGSLFNGVL